MTIKMHGKNYVTVAERVSAAHEAGGFTIVAKDIFTIADMGRWWYRVTIRIGEATFIGTAEIKFGAPKNTPDGANPVECAETSAVGRALGFAGFGMEEGIASAEEVQQAQHEQPAAPAFETIPANTAQLNMIAKLCREMQRKVPDVRGYDHANELVKQLSADVREWRQQRRVPQETAS